MSQERKIKSALISVYDKTGLEPIIEQLNALGVTIYSTGGTQVFIESMGVQVERVEDLTDYPSILGGRVKTLHPKVFGGILNRRNFQEDQAQIAEYDIPSIDLVIVDLYPFEETVASTTDHQAIIEKIDIGGISLIRAAAKNFEDVTIVPSMAQYRFLLNALTPEGMISRENRMILAKEAFQVSSHYDTHIYQYFVEQCEDESPALKYSESKSNVLRYGENPHQKGTFYGDLEALFDKLHGKELSYNNLLDVDAAVQLMEEFKGDAPTFAILKHNNACGLATRNSVSEAYEAALAADPVSAFGGILIANCPIDLKAAEKINELFCEVVICPEFDQEALELLKSKKNRILLKQKPVKLPKKLLRTALNGVLEQDKDLSMESLADLKYVTDRKPSEEEIRDLLFANRIAKHTKSNTIVLAKDKQLLASGTGQTSRVDALKQAILKAKNFGFDLQGAVMASDAFFPFPDCVEIAEKEGVKTVIQPGGSIKDELSIDYCNQHGVGMVMTGVRHFRH
ncbi:MAG: bifunctional phosphoribosylaminoimidazolecarboxamide formyltransferase/IMP cyclohydrolase [Bacteroidetes bacterium]|nr:MAG: bifunctional phosphoribosylaminoimidazolecarboxamide formyltransferase/IMP cyclohydrolase [Bacteroidota bacterium]